MLKSIRKNIKYIYLPTDIRTRHLWLPNRTDTPEICIIQDNFALQHMKCGRQGENQEKKKNPQLISIFSFRKSFRRKVKRFTD